MLRGGGGGERERSLYDEADADADAALRRDVVDRTGDLELDHNLQDLGLRLRLVLRVYDDLGLFPTSLSTSFSFPFPLSTTDSLPAPPTAAFFSGGETERSKLLLLIRPLGAGLSYLPALLPTAPPLAPPSLSRSLSPANFLPAATASFALLGGGGGYGDLLIEGLLLRDLVFDTVLDLSRPGLLDRERELPLL